MDKIQLGNKIASLRKENGFTQKELAELLYVSDKTVSKWETGVNYPDMAILERLCDVLKTNISTLLSDNENKDKVIDNLVEISKQKSNELKKEFKLRYWITLFFSVLGFVTTIILIYELGKIEENINPSLFGFISVIILNSFAMIWSSSMFWLSNIKKL